LMSALVEGFESGQFEAPLIARRFSLEHARQAYEAVAAGTAGRVVINL